MDYTDILLAPPYLLFIYFLAYFFRSKYPKGSPYRKYFIPALTVKIVGSLCFALIYQFYYKGGDTFSYYAGAKTIWEVFKLDPVIGIKMYFANPGEIDHETHYYTSSIYYFANRQTYIVVKLTSLLGLLCFNSYLVITFLFAFLSFTGTWALYRTFTNIYPELHKELAIAILFIPSVFFWGSGILKDTITLGCLGWLTASFYSFFVRKQRMLLSAVLTLLCSYLIFEIKPYILFTLAPGLLFWIIVTYRSKIKSAFFKFLITPIVIGFALMMNYFVIEELAKEEQKFSFEKFFETASSYQNWHGQLGQRGGYGGGSAYSLGEFDIKNFQGILNVIPKAINVTLFRPYLWEAKNIIMVFSAFESLAILFLTLHILFWDVGILKTLKIVYHNPEVFFSIIFTLVFAFAVGFSSYNFGALVRYKIPCIPFYVAALFIIKYIHQKTSPRTNTSIAGALRKT